MHYFVRLSLAAVGAAAISACTSIQVQRAEDDAGSLPDGLVYYLPAKQFSITVPFEVEDCFVDVDKAPAITYSIVPVVTETLVGDVSQVHVIRYSALAGKTKVTGFNIELFDNGTLKSVNAHAEDRTGQIITSTVQALGNVARGVALGKFYAAEVAEVTQDKLCSPQLIYLLTERDGAKQRLENEKDKDKGRRAKSAAVSEAVDALAEARVNARDAEKTGTAKDKADAKKAVAVAEERLNVVKAELEALGQSKADKNAADLAAARTALTQKVTLVWQPKLGDLQVQIRYPDQAWDKLLTDDGKKALQAKLGGADIRPASLNRLFALVKLSVAGMGDRSVGAKPMATNTAQGIVYRQPVSAQMTICAGDGCDSGAGIANAVLNQTFLIPQLGALGSLPLKNEVFEKNSLVLAQLADGTMVSLRFDADAALEKAAETAKQASETYMTTVSNLIQDRRTELNAQRDDRKKDREERKDERAERKDIREEGAAVRADANASLKEAAERITLMRDVEARRNGDMDKVQREIDRNAREKQLIDSQIELVKKRKELAKEAGAVNALRAFGLGAALVIAASDTLAQPAATTALSIRALSANGLDAQTAQSVARVQDPEVVQRLSEEGKSLQETARTEAARTALQRKLADRAFLYHLATGAVSAESLQRANLKREELLLAARSVDPHSPALVKARAAFNSNRILAIARSLGGWPSVQQVDPDTPASTDAVPTASATGPCNYNSSLNRCERLVYRQGFTEVVAVGQRAAGQPVGTIHCTGTMLKDGWLLTAAHCLFDKTGARIAQDKLIVYMPFQGSSEQAMAAQALNRNLRSFSVVPGSATLYDVEFQPSKLYDFESAKDLAVLRVSVPAGSATWRPVVLRTANKDMPFTSAGYGLTNAADPGVDGSTLEITRRTADVRVFPKYLLYESVSTKGMGRVCAGDSGGPVFAGELNGGPKPPEHELVGVVSGSTATGQSVAYCRAGNQYIVRVNTTEVAQWMCSSTKKAICY